MTLLRRCTELLGSVAVTGLLVLGWQVVTQARLVSPVFLPSPAHTMRALRIGLESGGLLALTGATVARMAYGWLCASLAGIALGGAIGISPAARAWLAPTLNALRPLPASALIPVGIALFGMSGSMVLAVVSLGALWPMLLATMHGFSDVEPQLYDVARALGMGRLSVVLKIGLPSAMPDILAGLRLGLTTALILTIVGEILSGQSGLGKWILLAARSFHSAELYSGVIVLGAIGLCSAQLINAFEAYVLRWRRQN